MFRFIVSVTVTLLSCSALFGETIDVLAPGAPGLDAHWPSAAKNGFGTSNTLASKVWFTLNNGVLTEVYYPTLDVPNVQMLQFVFVSADGSVETEAEDTAHRVEVVDPQALIFRQINTAKSGAYTITKTYVTDPERSSILIDVNFRLSSAGLCRCKLYVYYDPSLNNSGMHDSAWTDGQWLVASDVDKASALTVVQYLLADQTNGYFATSDGLTQLRQTGRISSYKRAGSGNVVQMAQVKFPFGGVRRSTERFTLVLSFGRTAGKAISNGQATVRKKFEVTRAQYERAWHDYVKSLPPVEPKYQSQFNMAAMVLKALEDKTFRGAIVASMSIPWGATKGDNEIGGYHLVWPRDLVQSASGLLASGQAATARAALIWLACLQEPDGELPQNSWIHGAAFWTGLQLDEVAAPILLAWHLHNENALRLFDPWTVVSRAASYLILYGPITRQERWEEASGYSPGTLAAIIAGLVIVAEFARARKDENTAQFCLDYADWLSAHLEEWTVTTCGELVPGRPRHYLRITPADCNDPHATAQPDTAVLRVANGGGEHPARNVVGGDFLSLVRLGLRDPHDPIIVDSLAVIDAVLKHDLPQGPCWQRYNHDGYGQRADGAPFDGAGVGGAWPLLTGERGHYELEAGRDPLPFIKTLERFSNAGGMLPEQVWCRDELAGARFKPGLPTGSAMPLCWAHAEYLSLVRSRADGVSFDRVAPAHQRYVEERTGSDIEMWTCTHRRARIPAGKTLRVISGAAAVIRWRASGGDGGEMTARETALGLWFADLPTSTLSAGTQIEFTLQCAENRDAETHRVGIIS